MNLVQFDREAHIGDMTRRSAPRATHDDPRGAALAEARNLLVEGGPDQVKARVLAARLGVSVGTIYNLFGDLDELLFHLNAEVYDELLSAVRSAREKVRAASGTAVEEMLALSHGYLAFVAKNQDLWMGVLTFNRRSKARVPEWYRAREREMFAVIAETIAAFPGAADVDRRKTIIHTLWAAVHGIITVSVGKDGLIASKEELGEQIEFVVRAVADRLEASEAPPKAMAL